MVGVGAAVARWAAGAWSPGLAARVWGFSWRVEIGLVVGAGCGEAGRVRLFGARAAVAAAGERAAGSSKCRLGSWSRSVAGFPCSLVEREKK